MYTFHASNRHTTANDDGVTLPLLTLTAWCEPADTSFPINLPAIAAEVLRATPGARAYNEPHAFTHTFWSNAKPQSALRTRFERECSAKGVTVTSAADPSFGGIIGGGFDVVYVAADALDPSATAAVTSGSARLLIWHLVPRTAGAVTSKETIDAALAAAQSLIDGGGPPVIVLRAASQPAGEAYAAGLVGNIFRNIPLPAAAEPGAALERAISVDLFAGQGTETILQLDRLIETVMARSVTLAADARKAHKKANEARTYAHKLLHERDATDVLFKIDEGLERIGSSKSIARDLGRLPGRATRRDPTLFTSIARNVFREDTLKMLMAEPREEPIIAADIPAMSIASVRTSVDRAAQSAPRVLNSGIATAAGDRVLDPHDPLQPASSFALLVDVGPKWDKTPSITKGDDAFPEWAVEQDGADGHVLDVVLVGEDLTPPISSQQIWLPAKTGRSSPIKDGQRGVPGPARIAFSTPTLDVAAIKVAARVSIYLGAELLQSGVLALTVAPAGTHELANNELAIDFVLTPDMTGLGTLGSRTLRIAEDEEPRTAPVTAGVTQNDNGFGSHRLMFKLDGKETFASLQFDAEAAKTMLETVRAELINSFFVRAPDGRVLSRTLSLDKNNKRTLDLFRGDLRMLALAGADIYDYMVQNLVPEANVDPIAWRAGLRAALKPGAVFRVARAGPSGYVLPWTVVYDIPLVNRSPTLGFCKVLADWNAGADLTDDCPYWSDADHRRDILCPYGFWGLRTVIEQPLSRDDSLGRTNGRPDNFRTIGFSGAFELSMARTADARLPRQSLLDHIAALKKLFAFSPDPAVETRAAALQMLEASKLVYFLCHGERDADRKDSYLGIGPRDANTDHRVYSKELSALSTVWIDGGHTFDAHPLVFINGCHTSDLSPGDIVTFVDAFRSLGASGLIGTEVSIQLQLAVEVAETLLAAIAGGAAIGEAMRRMRWKLARKWNLLGLAYVLYGFSDLQLVAVSAGAPSPVGQGELQPA